MKVQSKLRNFLLALSLATLANSASAAFINFIEDVPTDESPFTVSTDMLPGKSVINSDGVTFDGIIFPSISFGLEAGNTYIGGLLEPGDSNMVSDYVVLTAGDFRDGEVGGPNPVQPIHIDVFSIDRLLSEIITLAKSQYNLTISSANFLTENGELQDISDVMGTGGVEGVQVSIQSAIVENEVSKVPELSSLLLVSVGLAAFAGSRRKKQFLHGIGEEWNLQTINDLVCLKVSTL